MSGLKITVMIHLTARFSQLLILSALAAAASAQVVGTATVTDASHGDDFGSPFNTVANITPSTTAGTTFRQISYSGTLTSVIAGTYASEAYIDITGPDLATPQLSTIQLKPGADTAFTSTTFSGSIYAPGGVSATQTLSIEHLDSFDDGDGADETSTTTYSFNAGYTAAFSKEASGLVTSTSPKFNRPSSLTTLSSIGTNVGYNVQQFSVGTSGSYAFANASGYDSYLFLYTGAFNPAAPLSGLVALNDEAGNVLRSSAFAAIDPSIGSGGTAFITSTLTAGTSYFLVTSAYDNVDFGNYINAYVGPGAITFSPVPEPSMLAALGLALPLLARRRRAKRAA